MKEIKVKIKTGIDVFKNIDEINSNSQDLQNQSLTSSTKRNLPQL